MNVLSLFDGMSCGQIALNKLGIKIDNYFASEIDKYAMKVTQANFPNTVQLGDVMKLQHIDWTENPIDLMIGGSPCQNFSFAGKQKGMVTKDNIEITTLEQYLELKNSGFQFEGQSFLFWEYVRILKECKPKYFLLENVKMTKKWSDLISSIMGVEPILINSSLVSAQNRQRLYWTNIPGIEQPADRGILLNDILDNVYNGAHVEDTERNLRHEVMVKKKSLCCTATMYKGAGNNGMTLVRDINLKLRCLTVNEVERLQTVPDNYTDHVSNSQRYKMLGNGWTVDVIEHIFKNLKNI